MQSQNTLSTGIGKVYPLPRLTSFGGFTTAMHLSVVTVGVVMQMVDHRSLFLIHLHAHLSGQFPQPGQMPE